MAYSGMYVGLYTGVLIAVLALLIFYLIRIRRLFLVGYLILRVRPYQRFVSSEAPTILVAGDSTAYGTGVREAQYSVAGRIAADFPHYTIETRAVNGRRIDALAADMASLPNDVSYHAIVLQIGGNDVLQRRTAEQIEGDLRALLPEATARAQYVFMMSSGNVGAASAFVKKGTPDPEYERLTRSAREIFRKVCVEYGVTYVDLFLEPADDVFLNNPKRYLAIDGLHPSEEGYGFWYQSLQPLLREVLEGR